MVVTWTWILSTTSWVTNNSHTSLTISHIVDLKANCHCQWSSLRCCKARYPKCSSIGWRESDPNVLQLRQLRLLASGVTDVTSSRHRRLAQSSKLIPQYYRYEIRYTRHVLIRGGNSKSTCRLQPLLYLLPLVLQLTRQPRAHSPVRSTPEFGSWHKRLHSYSHILLIPPIILQGSSGVTRGGGEEGRTARETPSRG